MAYARGRVPRDLNRKEGIAVQQHQGGPREWFSCEGVVASVVYSQIVARRVVGWSSCEEGMRSA